MKEFLVTNESTNEGKFMNEKDLKELFKSLVMVDEDEELLVYWADNAESGDTTHTCFYGPYHILCL